MNNNYDIVLTKGIISTSKQYPDRDMTIQITNAVKKYFSILNKNGVIAANDIFCKCFTRTDKDTKEEVRAGFIRIGKESDVVLGLFDCMYKYAIDEIKHIDNRNDEYVNGVLKYIDAYIKLTKEYKTSDLSSAKIQIYDFPEKLIYLSNLMSPLTGHYVDKTLGKENKTVKVTEFTDTGKQLFSNIEDINNYKLADNFHGVYKSGNVNIQMASALGYKTKRKPQQDAVLSVSKNGYSLNVIADGAGGSVNGQIASTITVNELKNWFMNSNFSVFDNITPDDDENIKKASAIISNSLDDRLRKINQIVQQRCNQSYSTVVVSLVTPGFILFANVGDSTAYVYDSDKNTIKEKTVLDSRSNGLSYEDARHNPTNNQITNAVGMLGDNIHYNVMPNKGSYRIIMSSDGITDLISANNFAYMAANGYTASDFVRKADNMPDVDPDISKTQDNISAIIIDSDEYAKKRRAR